MTELLLASSSTYRKALLTDLGLTIRSIAPDIDEARIGKESAETMAERLAIAKARKVGNVNPVGLTLGSDQVAVVLKNGQEEFLGKPGTIDNACRQLADCQAKAVTFHTALCVYHGQSQKVVTGTERTTVYFKPLTTSAIAQYVNAEMPLDCAGSFKCEGLGALLFERIDGRDPNSLIGLPIMLLRDLLARFDVDLLDLATQARINQHASTLK